MACVILDQSQVRAVSPTVSSPRTERVRVAAAAQSLSSVQRRITQATQDIQSGGFALQRLHFDSVRPLWTGGVPHTHAILDLSTPELQWQSMIHDLEQFQRREGCSEEEAAWASKALLTLKRGEQIASLATVLLLSPLAQQASVIAELKAAVISSLNNVPRGECLLIPFGNCTTKEMSREAKAHQGVLEFYVHRSTGNISIRVWHTYAEHPEGIPELHTRGFIAILVDALTDCMGKKYEEVTRNIYKTLGTSFSCRNITFTPQLNGTEVCTSKSLQIWLQHAEDGCAETSLYFHNFRQYRLQQAISTVAALPVGHPVSYFHPILRSTMEVDAADVMSIKERAQAAFEKRAKQWGSTIPTWDTTSPATAVRAESPLPTP